ncbi:polymer-forming cytoskeletal protein [Natrialbaceae archaeon A-arb3/5]
MRRGGERGVTVQIGAVLLLAILFTALALYQVNAVPAENEVVEINHNDRVHDEMQELRNGIQNTGWSDETRSSSVTLGTQYPTRTFLLNPPDPSGSLETTGTETLTIENVDTVEPSAYDGDPTNLTGDHETTTLAYEPGYNEYDNAPTTRIEHGLAFNEFEDAAVTLTDQPIIDGDRINLVLVDGELAERSTGAVSVDSTVLSGPTDPIDVQTDGGSLEMPTESPSAWNETLDSQPNATTADYANGNLAIELEDGTYELRMTCVSLGDSPDETICPDLDISEQIEEDELGSWSPLNGPAATDLTLNQSTATQGEAISVTGNFTNRGITNDERGGTPIVDAEWYIDEVSSPEPGEGESMGSTAFEDELILSAEGTISESQTADLEPGEYTVVVRAKDTRGVWTNMTAEEHGVEEFEIEEDESPSPPPSPGPGPEDGFSYLHVESVTEGGNHEMQAVSFAPEEGLSAGESVTIDFSEAQDRRGSTTLDYQDATISDERVEVDHWSASSYQLTFTASESMDEEVVEFTIDGVEVGSVGCESYDVSFERDDGQTAETSFNVRVNDGSDCPESDDILTDSDVTLSESETVDGEVDAGGYVEFDEDVTVTGDVTSDRYLTVDEDGEIGGDVLANEFVELDEAAVIDGEVRTSRYVTLDEGGTVGDDIVADSYVELDEAAVVSGDVISGRYVNIDENGEIDGNIVADEFVEIDEDVTIHGDITSNRYVDLDDGTTVSGDVFTDDLRCGDGVTINDEPCEKYEPEEL